MTRQPWEHSRDCAYVTSAGPAPCTCGAVSDDGHVREFDCLDCGEHVVSFGTLHANDEPYCGTCQWIRALPSEADRERVREFLQRRK